MFPISKDQTMPQNQKLETHFLSPRLAIKLSSKGYILVTTMLMAILVMVVGIGASALSLTNVSISRNVRANADTRYLAEAAVDAVVGYIRNETATKTYNETSIVSTLIPNAENINISSVVPSCPSVSGAPCIDVNIEQLSTSRLDLLEIRAEIQDNNRDAEYSITAIVQLRKVSVPYSIDTPLLSDGYIELNGTVDLRGDILDDSDDAIAHGNDGYKISDDVLLPTDPDTLNLAITSGPTNSSCDGGSLVSICQTTSDKIVDLVTFDEALDQLTGSTFFPPTHDTTANDLSELQNRCQNGDVVRFYGSSISSGTLQDCVIVALNDLKLEGSTVVLSDTFFLVGGKIEVDGSTSFTGNNVLAARADGSSTNLGININNANVSADNLLIISAGKTELNADFTSTFISGIYSEGEAKINGNTGVAGFVWSHDNIILNGTVGAAANIINSLLPTASSYTYDALISRN